MRNKLNSSMKSVDRCIMTIGPEFKSSKAILRWDPRKHILENSKSSYLNRAMESKALFAFYRFFRITEALADLIDKLLIMDPKQRLTTE